MKKKLEIMSELKKEILNPTKSTTTTIADATNSSSTIPESTTQQQLQQQSTTSVDNFASTKDDAGISRSQLASTGSLEGAVAATSGEAVNNYIFATPQTSHQMDNIMANSKEKTPMCLLNELARHNQINPRYELVEESGPAHQKSFKVALTINDRKYEAIDSSIKKAQHSVAKMALEQCGLPKPRPKNKSYFNGGYNNSAEDGNAPTVELNGLAMKLGTTPIYKHLDQHPMQRMQHQHPPPPHFMYNMYYPRPQPNYNFHGIYHQRYHYPRPPRIHYVSLTVGGREFFGEGGSRQQARHNAATKAIRILQCEPIRPENTVKFQTPANQIDGSGDAKLTDGANSIVDENKSEISLCYEIANRRELSIKFEVVKESGLPHTKTFLMRCTLGQFVTEGEGNGKKESKGKAAQKMLEKLKELPPLPIIQKFTRPKFKRKKSASLVKIIQPGSENSNPGINPISRLVQLQQAKKEKEPVFKLLQERGLIRKREFIMEVTVGEHTVRGIANTKKLAKKLAAEKMLTQLGYRSSPPTTTNNIPQPLLKSVLKYTAATFATQSAATATANTTTTGLTVPQSNTQQQCVDEKTGSSISRKVKFADSNTVSAKGDGKRLAPGLLPMKALIRSASDQGNGTAAAPANSSLLVTPNTIAAMARELLADGSSPTAQALLTSSSTGDRPPDEDAHSNPKHQLQYLSKILKMQPKFSDYSPKNAGKDKYMTSASVALSPPVVAHGLGESLEASHNMAALEVLQCLAKLTNDNSQPTTSGQTSTEAAALSAPLASYCSTAEVSTKADQPDTPLPVLSKAIVVAAGDSGEPAQENLVVIKETVSSGTEGRLDVAECSNVPKLVPAANLSTPTTTSNVILNIDTTTTAISTTEMVKTSSDVVTTNTSLL